MRLPVTEYHLHEVLEAACYQILHGDKYLWNSYGENCQSVDFSTEFAFASVIYDLETLEAREITVSDTLGRNQNYRWRHPGFIKANEAEYKSRGYASLAVSESERWTDTDVFEDILEKMNGMLLNHKFEIDPMIQVNMSWNEHMKARKIAADQGLTFEAWFVKELERIIEEKK